MKHSIGMTRNSKIIFSIFFFVIGLTMFASAQALRPKRLTVNCDIAQFRNTSERGYLELYFGFSPNQLTLHQLAGKVSGGVNLTFRLISTTNGEPVLRRRYYFPVQLADTSNAALYKMFISQRAYEVPFGRYRFEVVATDSFDTSHRDSISFNTIDIVPMGTAPRGSDLELCSSITSSNDTTQLFYKNTFNAIPNPSLVFGKTSYPVVFHYLEAYNLNKDSLYTVETAVKNLNGEIKKSSSRQKHYGVNNAVEVGTTTIMNLPSGKYLYQVRILDGGMKEVIAAQKYLFIHNPQIVQTTSPISVKAVEFLGMTDDELANEFRTSKYLATDQEIKAFSNVTNAEGRREFLAKFWSDIENGRQNQNNLTRAMYKERVLTANQRYHAMGKEGWQTDRGRVYLIYSEPDEVERFPSTTDGKPYEIWDYNQIENGVIFVFIDQTGFGDYRLVHSTKRGELQDESWQQHLQ
jgi:GWxTD domain-containing protein